MSLVLLKLREGYRFGDVLLGGRVPGIHDPEQQQLQHQQQTIQGLDVVIKESYSSSISKWVGGKPENLYRGVFNWTTIKWSAGKKENCVKNIQMAKENENQLSI